MPLGYYSIYFGFDASIAVDPHDALTVYVGQEMGVYKTTDGGAKWTRILGSYKGAERKTVS